MAHLGEGGPARVKFDTSYPYELSASLHFSNQGHGVRPSTVVPLWGGGGFNADYNASHPPITFEVPEGTQRAEVVAFITGHGFNNDSANCAEFCNHEHHFQANGGTVHTDSHPEADNIVGCVEQIEDGTVPNQFGTWPFGRGGWCPGLDVPPWRADLTEDLIEGTNTITYEASLAGNPPDNAGSIWMTSYLVFYR